MLDSAVLYPLIPIGARTVVDLGSVPSVPAPSMQALMADPSSETDGRGLE